MENEMAKVSIQSLLEAGAHFGHQTRRWNPKMKPYIFGSRGDIYILDLKQTLIGMDKAYTFVSDLARKGGVVLFVGTKKQAQEPIVEADGRMALLPKKEQILLRKELAKLQTNLNGIRNMKKVPDAVFVIDTCREQIAIHEAKRLEIPVVGTLDTNCDPDDVDFGIPANDDAIRSVRMLADFIADAVIAGSGAEVTVAEMAGAVPEGQVVTSVVETPEGTVEVEAIGTADGTSVVTKEEAAPAAAAPANDGVEVSETFAE